MEKQIVELVNADVLYTYSGKHVGSKGAGIYRLSPTAQQEAESVLDYRFSGKELNHGEVSCTLTILKRHIPEIRVQGGNLLILELPLKQGVRRYEVFLRNGVRIPTEIPEVAHRVETALETDAFASVQETAELAIA